MDFASLIKERVSTPELFARYGFERDRRGMVCCMFHSDKHPSMRVYDGSGGYHCFSCHAHGDVISFVQQYYGLSFMDAISKINVDFGLGLPINTPIDNALRLQLRREADERRARREATRKERERLSKAYDDAMAEWVRLERQRTEYAPTEPSEPFNDLFIEAVTGAAAAEEAVELAKTRLYLFERNTRDMR